MWFEIIAANIFLGLACYARGLYLELKSTKQKLEQAQSVIRYLKKELTANQKKTAPDQNVSNIPAFLLADDPMDALLSQVGRARK